MQFWIIQTLNSVAFGGLLFLLSAGGWGAPCQCCGVAALDLLEQYRSDPQAVDASWRQYFDRLLGVGLITMWTSRPNRVRHSNKRCSEIARNRPFNRSETFLATSLATSGSTRA